ncbi:ATP-binding protein [Actinoallomurus spadix]|uniref:Histidine kinase/HSP90-like ATPase domain-containing protein n=1 Tax=Actinoallomurus spadix TaxID=79912 RepID=A0ABP3HGF9_9ACTN|nr:ATP-binding protein [Actinoallomurus spadix]MCO5985118.1 ATP-binding protein [Actinoallomurus spadix]
MSALPTEAPTNMHSPFRPRPERVSEDLRLLAQPTAVGAARAFVRDQLNRWRLNEPTGYDLPGTAELITSELVTNSLKATGVPRAPAKRSSTVKPGVIVLRMRLIRRSLFVEVWDANPCPPVLANGGELEENGRGLVLVTALAKAWDYYDSDAAVGGKVVWAELDIPAELSGFTPLTNIQQGPPRLEPDPGSPSLPTRHVPGPPTPDGSSHHWTHPGRSLADRRYSPSSPVR